MWEIFWLTTMEAEWVKAKYITTENKRSCKGQSVREDWTD